MSTVINYFKRVNSILMLAVIVVVALLFAIWWVQQPKLYRLQVVNNSDLMIDQARVLGSALVTSNTLVNLPPGSYGLLKAQLSGEGQLRFEISQQGTKVDMLVVKKGSPEHWVQSLSVENKRRFLLSEGLLVL